MNIENPIFENNKPLIYIAGKVTGLPYDEVYTKFRAKQLQLEEAGYNVLNPCEAIDKDCNWSLAMRKAITMLCSADFICLLPDWHSSEGAKVERSLALKLNIPTIED